MPNAMPARPTPPTITGGLAEFEAHYENNPEEWYRFIREAHAWMTEQETAQAETDRKLIELQVQVENLQEELQASYAQIAKATTKAELFEERLNSKEEELKILQLDLYKAQTAALPTVASLTPLTVPDTMAKAPVVEAMGTPPTPVTRSTASAHLSERIPDPDKFEGSRADLRRFRIAITEKLDVNKDRFPTAASRVAYINSRLGKEAHKLIHPYTRNGICRLSDYHEVLDILQKAYGDPNEARTARRELDSIKQGNRDFSTFYAEFQSLSVDSGLEGDFLAAPLEKAVSKELSDMLLHNPPADYSYDTLVSHFQELDTRLREHRERTRPYTSKKQTATPYIRPARYQTTRQERKSPSPRRGRSPPERAQPSGDPMDLSNQRRYQRPSYRRENNQCFRCGSSTHYIRDCPEPDTRPAKFRHAAITYSPRHPSRQESPKSPTSSRSDSHNSQIYQENGASLS
jgi:hypothetical protein